MKIAKQAGSSIKDKFNYEIKLRKEVLYNFKEEKLVITPQLITGTYRVIGQNPDDQKSCYIGNVEIYYENKTWKATWSIAGFVHHAYGMLVTSNMLVFNYSYQDGDGDTRVGLVSYTFLTEVVVKGEWIEEGFPDKGIEELRKISDSEDTSIDSHDANFGFSLN